MYITERKFHNLQILGDTLYDPIYGFPCLVNQTFGPARIDSTYNLVGFNMVKSDVPEKSILHFYLDDYQFERLWNYPSRYLGYIRKFDFCISPDFSVYVNLPQSIAIYNKYRNNLLSVFLQQNGIDVIPCVQWGDLTSYDYSFRGIPKYSIISITSQGWLKSDLGKRLFINGFRECNRRLKPSLIIFYGEFLPELEQLCDCDILVYKPFIRTRFEQQKREPAP